MRERKAFKIPHVEFKMPLVRYACINSPGDSLDEAKGRVWVGKNVFTLKEACDINHLKFEALVPLGDGTSQFMFTKVNDRSEILKFSGHYGLNSVELYQGDIIRLDKNVIESEVRVGIVVVSPWTDNWSVLIDNGVVTSTIPLSSFFRDGMSKFSVIGSAKTDLDLIEQGIVEFESCIRKRRMANYKEQQGGSDEK